MAHTSRTTGNAVASAVRPRTGRHTFIAAGTLLVGFTAFWYQMNHRDQNRRTSGRLEQYESAITEPRFMEVDSSSSLNRRDPVPLPVKEHNAKHITIETARSLPGQPSYISQPAPQRPKGDGSGLVYTKKA
ncbi:hypothetical protein D9758_013307 [Tetrapyrgos nigripes]|uniref:Uncharacterized protein n=1 Tax=Tetrapyrgos nigripes TaxID=182062 RepID=A0A8H5FJA8_9AGAR|nr:hypothetical protein D9758_013307 [Tetrapyrgos nigripes]